MLSGLIRQSVKFRYGNAPVCLRYDMAALLFLEKRGIDLPRIFGEITDDELKAFFEAGLGELKSCTEKLFTTIRRSDILTLCRAAVMEALPKDDPLRIPKPPSAGAPPFDPQEHLFTLICDVMGKPEDFFWTSTLRELTERWERYAVSKGYAKAPERIQMYDTEGME